jgi:predicted dehydrogenase
MNIGLIGAGANTRDRHIPGFQAIDGVSIVAVANRSRESGERVAKEFGIAHVFESPEALIADPDVDAVCIGTWPYRHRDYTITALEAGKHVLCEARMAGTLEESEQMLEAEQRHPELVAQLVPAPFDLRLGPTVTRMIADGTLGKITEVAVTSMNPGALNPATPIHWRQQQKYSGRNMGMLGIWGEVIQRWLGDIRVVAAHGTIATRERPDPSTGGMAEVDVPDTVSVVGELMDGAQITFRVGGVAAGAPDNGVVVYGTKATIRWHIGDTAEWAVHGQPFATLEPDPGTASGWQVEADFVASVTRGMPVTLTNFTDGVRYMRFVDACWRSWQEGRRIEVG